jgi:hypothetical protein
MVKLARARYPEFQQDIIEVDATNSENLPIKQDLVLLRKPQVFGNSIKEHLQEQIVVSWQKILSNASDVIDMDGHLILTTPTIEEMEATIKYLKDQRPELVSELGKPFHQIDIPQDPVIGNEDKYIAVMRRKP